MLGNISTQKITKVTVLSFVNFIRKGLYDECYGIVAEVREESAEAMSKYKSRSVGSGCEFTLIHSTSSDNHFKVAVSGHRHSRTLSHITFVVPCSIH